MPRRRYLLRIQERAARRPAGGGPGDRQPRQFRPPLSAILLRRAVPARSIFVRPRPLVAVGHSLEPAVAECGGDRQDRRPGPALIAGRRSAIFPRALCFAALAAQARRLDRQPCLLSLILQE